MRLLILSALLLLSLDVSLPAARAQSRLTVQQLREICASEDAQRQSVCNAYVAGVRHTLDVFKNSLKQRLNYCIPPGATNVEIRDAFVRWAAANAAAAGQAAVAGLIRAVHLTYPCRKGEPLEF